MFDSVIFHFGNDDTIPVPTLGDTFTCTGLKYKVLTFTTVSFIGLETTKSLTSITIPATVKIGSATFKVTDIAANAMKKDTKVTTLAIGKYVKTIGKNAFNGCKALKTITVKTTKLTTKNVGASAFKNIYKKATFKCPAKKLKAYEMLFKSKGAAKTCNFTK